jgi:hypothetical protein
MEVFGALGGLALCIVAVAILFNGGISITINHKSKNKNN